MGTFPANLSEICMWNLSDGRCLVQNSKIYRESPHTLIVSGSGKYILIFGKTEELVIVNVANLEV